MNVSLFRVRCAALTATATVLAAGAVIGLNPVASHATPISPDLLSPSPVGSEGFGEHVLVLSNGNYVVVDSKADGAGADVGAVYLYNGTTDSVISTLTGSASGDQIGSDGVTEVGTSDFVVLSSSWHVGAAAVGAATWVDGTSGLTGVVSAANSLVGSTKLDFVGAAVDALSNGNYVVSNPKWDGAATDVGAVTWSNADGGTVGAISADNSLIGVAATDNVGSGGVTALSNGNYVVSSPNWDNGPITNAGAVTWGSGEVATSVSVSSANSIVGSSAGDQVGFYGATALTNGNYVIDSPYWNSGASNPVGAVTWAGGIAVTSDTVSTSNSLVGSTSGDLGNSTVSALTNGNYVVTSPFWDGPAAADVGAATWASGTAPTHAAVTAANSLVGATADDNVGYGGSTALSNGNYVVDSPFWSTAATSQAGAVTWAAGDAVTAGTVSPSNSLIGTRTFDNVGVGGVTALTNGNYVVSTPSWDNVLNADVGAVTWVGGDVATSATVSTGNSIVGTTVDDGFLRKADRVGSGGVTALTDGNYVVSSPGWNAGGGIGAGAVTWADGTAPTSTTVSPSNSLVGSNGATESTSLDHVGVGGVTAMAGGNFVVSSPRWSNGTGVEFAAPGAATFGPAGGIIGTVTNVNSAIGTQPVDVLSGSPRLTGLNEVLVATRQNRVLRFEQTDFQPPVIVAGDVTVHAADAVGPVAVTFPTIATDNVGVSSASCTPASGFLFPIGSTVVTCTATDTAVPVANSASATFTVTVLPADVVPPVLTVPSTIHIGTAPGASTQSVAFAVTATDNVGIRSVGCAPASGSVFALGNTTVSCAATDTSGLSVSKTFTVSVSDLEPPVLVGMPGNVTVTNAPGTAARAVTYTAPTATDNIAVASVGCTPTSGSSFPIGVTAVACTAVDTSGLTATNTFNVAVNDVDPPVLGELPDKIRVDAAAGTTSRTVTFATPTATDNDAIRSVSCTPSSGTAFPTGITTVTCTATDHSGLTASKTFNVEVSGTSTSATTDYVSLSGARLADTRPDGTTTDAQFARQGIRGAGSTFEVTVAGRGGVAGDATAVALNVTAVESTGNGFVTVFPCGSARPTASNLNYTVGAIVPNAVITKIGSDGKVCLFVSAPTHLVVDVNGYFPPSTMLQAFTPVRVLETRSGLPTGDGKQQGIGVRLAGSTTAVQITGRASVPTDATAVVLNVTVTDSQAPGFATVFPCGSPVPTASNINYGTGSTVANLVVSKIGDVGRVCVFTNQATDLVVDVAGYFPLGTSYQSLIPARLLETRPGESTIDGQFLGAGLREAGQVTELTVTNRGNVPAGAGAVVLNVTVTGPTAAGFVTVYPCGIATPLASNLNYAAGETVANAVLVRVGSDGKVCLFNSTPTHLVVDVNGYFPA